MSGQDPARDVGAVVIGRNEGARLGGALRSVASQVARVVYVDSGSRDDSVRIARDMGAEVVSLDMTVPFTAARARNAGLAHPDLQAGIAFVQFMDGDCTLDPGWVAAARTHLRDHPDCAVVCGRRRERAPDASVYNRLCDAEWDTPPGAALACGGDALFRAEALAQVDGFDPSLIAGEEPDLCFRLRRNGWRVWRLDREMTLHDAAMTRFGQWWTRRKRGGHAFAEGYARHGRSPERYYRREVLRILGWAVVLPVGILLASALVWPWGLALAAIYPAQIARIAVRAGATRRWSWIQAGFLVLGFFAEVLGMARYLRRRLTGDAPRLIEYK